MERNNFKNLGIALAAIGLVACNDASKKSTMKNDNSVSAVASTMATEELKWVSLFDGRTLNGWHGYNETGEVKNWTIEEGALVCLGAAHGDTGGDIVTDKEFENFELTWEWKITKGGNTGVMYHVVEDPKYQAPYETGPEYQVIDDIGFPDKLEEWQKTGADYAMNLPNDKKRLKPVGEWNASKIVFNKGHVEHWLNGEKIVAFQTWDEN